LFNKIFGRTFLFVTAMFVAQSHTRRNAFVWLWHLYHL